MTKKEHLGFNREFLTHAVNKGRTCSPVDKIERGPSLAICIPGGLNFNHLGHCARLPNKIPKTILKINGVMFHGCILCSGNLLGDTQPECLKFSRRKWDPRALFICVSLLFTDFTGR